MSNMLDVMELLRLEESLPIRCHDHKLSGDYLGCRECHVEPDWLLVYRYIGDDEIRFERTGTHADLFE
jgi:mRNA interferase YafQ